MMKILKSLVAIAALLVMPGVALAADTSYFTADSTCATQVEPKGDQSAGTVEISMPQSMPTMADTKVITQGSGSMDTSFAATDLSAISNHAAESAHRMSPRTE